MSESIKKGLFITFEGIDGSGKTTQIELLNDYLKEKNYKTFLTREPGASQIGKKLREILLHQEGFVSDVCEMFLYLADRAQHIEEIVLTNVKKGVMVLCDRHIDSTVAYQGYGRGKDINQIDILNNIATNNYKPDLTFVFDLDVKTAQERVGSNKDRLESQGLEFFEKIRHGYLELAKKYPTRIKVIDASKSKEEIFEQVKQIIDKCL